MRSVRSANIISRIESPPAVEAEEAGKPPPPTPELLLLLLPLLLLLLQRARTSLRCPSLCSSSLRSYSLVSAAQAAAAALGPRESSSPSSFVAASDHSS